MYYRNLASKSSDIVVSVEVSKYLDLCNSLINETDWSGT